MHTVSDVSRTGRVVRLPAWFTQEIPGAEAFARARLFSELGITTVCQQAQCPNLGSCFKDSRLTFMILGKVCTRSCRFCAVGKSRGAASAVDPDEPCRISRMVKSLGLRYVVVTSVNRDDLPDGGAVQFARTIASIHALGEGVTVEVLIPDFSGDRTSLKIVTGALPAVVAHNIETVWRLYPEVRPQADYGRSLILLKSIKELHPALITKSSLMVGLGETEDEVTGALKDLRGHSCDCVTLGQYLAPSSQHYPVKDFISPRQFERYRQRALALGFTAVVSGPLARSSYNAEQMYYHASSKQGHNCYV